MVQHGDVIKFNGKLYSVEIGGYQGAYQKINGQVENCATGTMGYLTDLETGHNFRAEWSKDTEVVVKAENTRIFRSAIRALKIVYED